MSDGKKTKKVVDTLDKIEAAAGLGRIVPGSSPIVDKTETVIEATRAGLTVFSRFDKLFGGLFRKKKR
jgi:hypothetical protein